MRVTALALFAVCSVVVDAAADERPGGRRGVQTVVTPSEGQACFFGTPSDGWALRTISERESKQRDCSREDNPAKRAACASEIEALDDMCAKNSNAIECIPAYRERATLVATLSNPPRSRVVLQAISEAGDRAEILWDPAASDGVHQALYLGPGEWRIAVSAEEQVLQTDNLVATIATTFSRSAAVGEQIDFTSTQTSTSLTLQGGVSRVGLMGSPSTLPLVSVLCRSGTVAMDEITLDPRRAAAASTARGLLDQSVPSPIKEALLLMAEIAVERAKAGAMDILRDRFVTPMCARLTLKSIGLDRVSDPSDDADRAFRRVCALLENMRLQDALSSGSEMLLAVRDDLRLTLVPSLVDVAPGLGTQTRELLKVVMIFANRVIDGESSQVAEVDLLVALLDRLAIANTLSPRREVAEELLRKARDGLLNIEDIKLSTLSAALPVDFGNDEVRREWHSIVDAGGALVCARRYIKENSTFYPPSRQACLNAIQSKLIGEGWIEFGSELFPNFRTLLVSELARALPTNVVDDLVKSDSSVLEDPLAQCASRLVVAVAKWCSHRDRCSAGDVGAIFDRPWEVFSPPSDDSSYAVCMDPAGGGRWFREGLPNKVRYIQLATTLVSFLAPVPAGQERARTIAMVRWMFEFVRTQSGADSRLKEVEEMVSRLLEGDYVRAATHAVLMLQSRCHADASSAAESCSGRLKKVIQLLGALASYSKTYEASQGLDAGEARKQRKAALEALIDSATDRGERGGDFVVGLGSNVGAGGTWSLTRRDSYEISGMPGFGVRVPVGLSLQWLPAGRNDDDTYWRPSWLGGHLGVTVADLGQFLATDENGAVDDVRWSNFVSPGVEAGLLFGSSSHVLTLSLFASYPPALFEESDADGKVKQGAFRFGATLGYYVPFFDLN